MSVLKRDYNQKQEVLNPVKHLGRGHHPKLFYWTLWRARYTLGGVSAKASSPSGKTRSEATKALSWYTIYVIRIADLSWRDVQLYSTLQS